MFFETQCRMFCSPVALRPVYFVPGLGFQCPLRQWYQFQRDLTHSVNAKTHELMCCT